MSEISFNSDIIQFSKDCNHKIVVQDTILNIHLKDYVDISVVDAMNKWQTCFGMLGKGNLFQSKDASKILYCILTDCKTIDKINDKPVSIDLYNEILDRFYQIECTTKNNRNFKLKIFPICNTVIIIDWKNYPKYSIYELYCSDQIKEYYGTKKVMLDRIIKDINLKPRYIGDISSLTQDFKVFSFNNIKVIKDQRENNIRMLEDFMKHYKVLEKQIQVEYKKFKS